MTEQQDPKRLVPALKFKQWLDIWDGYDFDPKAHRRRPDPHIYLFSMPAGELRRLCDVYRRQRIADRAEGIQRARDESRTARIQRYVRFGYPYGDLKTPLRNDANAPLRKPGWLPTAIVVNILIDGDERRGKSVRAENLVTVAETDGRHSLVLPDGAAIAADDLAPMEVIDGQHRLWAFDQGGTAEPIPDDFELPVVAFKGLDVAWQAYLFWSINVSPKKINPSHAFDLYPLLRTQDWLEQVGELAVYREARAQELTESLFSHPLSTWVGRINMLGERGGGDVSQAAWVRSLSSTFFGTGRGGGQNGLFQGNLPPNDEPLEWARSQQAAFLIQLWRDVEEAVKEAPNHWWIRCYGDVDRALHSRTSMLNQDMGVRALLTVSNEIFFGNADYWRLHTWSVASADDDEGEASAVTAALKSLQSAEFRVRIKELAVGLARFDWRSSDGPDVSKESEEVQIRKRSYRGSGGYAQLRLDVLRAVAEVADLQTGTAAAEIIRAEVAE
jgi:hypothetical protein